MKGIEKLTPECEKTARLYALGYEKKEIARIKCRAVATVNAQLQKAFSVLGVRNGRELAMMYRREEERYNTTKMAMSCYMLLTYIIGSRLDRLRYDGRGKHNLLMRARQNGTRYGRRANAASF